MLIKYNCSDKNKVCKICGEQILKNIWCIEFEQLHVPPKHVNVFFHEGCFMRSLDDAQKNRNKGN